MKDAIVRKLGYSPETSIAEIFFEEVMVRLLNAIIAELVSVIILGFAILVLMFAFNNLQPNITHCMILQQLLALFIYWFWFGRDD